MSRPLLSDAFAHHVWATIRLIDTCLVLSEAQMATAVPGTYGSILDTMRHLVDSDCGYLFVLTYGRVPRIDGEGMDLPALRAVMDRNGTAWATVVAQDIDPDVTVSRRREDGSQTSAPIGIRLAQAIHHGTDHRSQICTALTALGVEPPAIDVWDFADHDGRLTEVPATP